MSKQQPVSSRHVAPLGTSTTASVAARAARLVGPAALALALAASGLLLAFAPPASAITRDVVMARAQAWVDAKVEYSWEHYSDETGAPATKYTGYRQDCSGFVSMCWTLRYDDGTPRSYTTDTLGQVSEPIGKADLLPGDILLKPKTSTTSGHALIFGGWADETASDAFWIFHQSSSAKGTVTGRSSYDYWIRNGYKPYRHLGIEEDHLDVIEPVRGYDRYATAVAASASTFATGSVDSVVVCSGADWPDALGGAALAGVLDSPVLLVRPDRVPASVASEIRRLGVESVILLGGEAAVSPQVAEDLLSLTGVTGVRRIGGRDRYETAALAADEALRVAAELGIPSGDGVFVASGSTFPDALAASSAAVAGVRPILLSRPTAMPAVTQRALRRIAPSEAIVLGSDKALSAEVYAQVEEEVASLERLGGRDRYETAVLVAEWSVGEGLVEWRGVGIATGEDFPDALSGGPALAHRGSSLLLTRRDVLPSASGDAFRAHRAEIGRAVCFGGMSAVSADVRGEIAGIIRAAAEDPS